MSWISGAYDVIIHGPYLKRTQLLCVIWRHRLWTACPCLSLSAVVFSRSIGMEFVHWTWICLSTCANLNIRSFNLNYRYMATSKQANKQADIHTHVSKSSQHRNAVTLVWGSLRLAPTKTENSQISLITVTKYLLERCFWVLVIETITN